MAKKKKSKKKNSNLDFNAEYNNLIFIFVGIFLLYSLNSNSMGLLGSAMQSLFKGLFGGLSIIIPFIIMFTGILGFFEANEYIYRIKNTKVYYVVIGFIFVFYGLLNARSLPVDSPLKTEMLKPVIQMGISGEGSGLVATTITYYIREIFGITGGWLISIFALLIAFLFTFNISIKDLILNIRAKSKSAKNGNLNVKDVFSNMKKSAIDMITDEVDEATVVEKDGLFKGFKSKQKDNDTKETSILEDEADDKTIKIVGFNKAEDDYLEILEGTQSMSELEVLNELKDTNKESNQPKKVSIEKTQPLDFISFIIPHQ